MNPFLTRLKKLEMNPTYIKTTEAKQLFFFDLSKRKLMSNFTSFELLDHKEQFDVK